MPQSVRPIVERSTQPGDDVASPSRVGASGEVARQPQEWASEGLPEPVTLRELLGTLRRRRGAVLAVLALALAVSAYSARRVTPQYQTKASVRLADPRRAMTSNLTSDESQSGGGGSEDRRVSMIQLLTSRAFVTSAVNRDPVHFRIAVEGVPAEVLQNVVVDSAAGADSVVLNFGTERVAARGEQGAATEPYGSQMTVGRLRFTVNSRPRAGRAVVHVASAEEAVSRVLGGLQARPRDQADVIDVTLSDGDPRFAQGALNTLVTAFAAGDVEEAQAFSQRRSVFIDEQLRRNDSALAVTEAALAAFRARQGTFSARDKFSAEEQSLAGLATQRNALLAERAGYESLLAMVGNARAPAERARLLTSLAAVAGGNAVMSQLYAQLAVYQSRRDSMTIGPWAHAPTHPDVQQVDLLLASVEAKLVEAARAHVASLDDRSRRIAQAASRNSTEMQRLPAVEAEELRLSNAVESLRKLGEQLRDESLKSRISKAVQVGHLEILDLATLPLQPLGRSSMSRMLTGLLIGLVLGCAAAFLRDRLDTTIARRSELQRLLSLDPLAVVPTAAGRRSIRERLGLRRARGTESGLLSPTDPATENAYVTLRTNLTSRSQLDGGPRTILVTSSAPEEGKTTVCSNLARAYAKQGRRVLVISADLRRPTIDEVFGVSTPVGLTDVLLGRADAADVIRDTSVPNVSLLCAGQRVDNPADLLATAAFPTLLTLVSRLYDVVLIDTPPVLAVMDAVIIAPEVDAVVFVVRAGATQRDAAQMAIGQLTAARASIAGAVLNDPDGRVGSYPGHYDYAEYYAHPVRA